MKKPLIPLSSSFGKGGRSSGILRSVFVSIAAVIILSLAIPTIAHAQIQTGRAQLRNAMRGVVLRYNRVEGMFGGYQLKLAPQAWNGGSVWIETGLGLENKKTRWTFGGAFERPAHAFRLSVFDRTETEDRDIISTSENTFFALLFKGDYRNYFRAKNGFEVAGRYRLKPGLNLSGTLTAYTYESMAVVATQSLFRSGRPFRINPAVTPGKIGRFYLGLIYDTRRHAPRFYNAWHILAFYERGFREFPLDGLHLTAVRHQKTIWGNQAFILRGRLATRTHTAEQFLFDIGGVGTLRGFSIKEFTGNRMIMFSLDYMFRGDIFRQLPIPAAPLFNLVAFADTGWTNLHPKGSTLLSGFNASAADFKTNIGLAIGITERLFRFNIARRLDRDHDAWTFSARFLRAF
jgi:hypothetical protein